MSLRARVDYLTSSAAYRRHRARTLLRLGAWRLFTAAGISRTVTLEPWRVRVWLPAQWRGVAKLVYVFLEDYESELGLVHRLLKRGGIFVDAGAAFGVYSLVASRAAGEDGMVVAFEPAAGSRAILERNVLLNQVTNVRICNSALVEGVGTATLGHDPDPGKNAILPSGQAVSSCEPIGTAALDNILTSEERSRVSVFKLDIEGAEELALRGARKTLLEAAPHIIFEVNPEAAVRLSLPPDGAWRLLEEHGYGFYRADPAGDLSPQEQPPAGGNVVAIHASRRSEVAGS